MYIVKEQNKSTFQIRQKGEILTYIGISNRGKRHNMFQVD